MGKLEEILEILDTSVAEFQNSVPSVQKNIFSDILVLIKDLKLKDGKILSNVQNMKLLSKLKSRLSQVFYNDSGYNTAVVDFTNAYDQLAELNVAYFKEFNKKFTPSATLPIVKDLAIENVMQDLVGQGLQVNVIEGVRDILKTNVTTGGSYSDLSDQLRNHILGDPEIDGSLVKYTKTITTDSINQFNAQYHTIIAQDLNFEWGRYVGSLLTTSRQFCVLLTGKQWVHRVELPRIVSGDIDGEKCKLNPKTDLPLGMIDGTNATNFQVLRGGYNCGHHFFWVPKSAVPKWLMDKFGVSVEIAKKAEASGPEVDMLSQEIAEKYHGKTASVNFKSVQSIEEKLGNYLGDDPTRLKDAVRNTVIVKNKDLNNVVKSMQQDSRFTRIKLQDGPEYYGYRGVISNFKTKNGLEAEIQVNTPGMIYAKVSKKKALGFISESEYDKIEKETGLPGGLGHDFYEKIRVINPITATAGELMERDVLIQQSDAYYRNFYDF